MYHDHYVNGNSSKAEPQTAQPSNQSAHDTGISQFLGKILDQLSVSAWLPSTMLVGNLAVLVQLRAQRDLNFAKAIASLTNQPIGIIIVLLFSLVLGTMITQAFQFEAIRLLEGYWGSDRFRSAIARLRVKRHAAKMRHLEKMKIKQTVSACRDARRFMIDNNLPISEIAMLHDILGANVDDQEKVRRIEYADIEMQWTVHASADQMRRTEALTTKLKDYPADHRILPTRLGNTLRAREDQLDIGDGDLEGFVIRSFDQLPGLLRSQHDQYRNRLDMYSSLMLIFVLLSVLAPILLADDPGRFFLASICSSSMYLIFAAGSYSAAITSAKGYGTVLLMINENVSAAHAYTRDQRNHDQ
jgi:hypothetical protein